jgi:hypothetical protein
MIHSGIDTLLWVAMWISTLLRVHTYQVNANDAVNSRCSSSFYTVPISFRLHLQTPHCSFPVRLYMA